MTVNYNQYLSEQINSLATQRKSDRTKARLRQAAADVLAEKGYRDMKVSDICESAGLASGTFYLYFQNKAEISVVVLRDFLDFIDTIYTAHPSDNDPFQAMYHANLKWIESIRSNTGLFRCILQVDDEFQEVFELIHVINSKYYERIARRCIKFYEAQTQSNPDDALMTVITLSTYSIGSMMDELARKLVVVPDQSLHRLVAAVVPTNEELAEFLSLLWFRALYGSNPKGHTFSGQASKTLARFQLPF